VEHGGVTILAPVDLPSGVAQHSSKMLSTNISALLALIVKDGSISIDVSDDIVDSVLVTHKGAVRIPSTGG
jgi:NAD(P) transhydrogenase subunit alpha